MEKDEDITCIKMLSCKSELPAPPQKRKDAENDTSIKNIVLTHMKECDANYEKNEDESANALNEDPVVEEEDSVMKSEPDEWLKSPEKSANSELFSESMRIKEAFSSSIINISLSECLEELEEF